MKLIRRIIEALKHLDRPCEYCRKPRPNQTWCFVCDRRILP